MLLGSLSLSFIGLSVPCCCVMPISQFTWSGGEGSILALVLQWYFAG